MFNEDGEGARKFDLEDRLIDFAIRALTVVDALPDTRVGRHVAGQLVRSGSSSAPNYSEACAAESRRDFIHKMKVCHKELKETRTWLIISQRKPLIEPASRLDPILAECNELIAIFGASIDTAKKRLAIENSGAAAASIEHCVLNIEY